MDFHQWQQLLLKELQSLQVPHDSVNRLIDEISNHYLDMQEAAMMNSEPSQSPDILKMMGDPKTIAQAAAWLPRLSWAARHPWLSYLVLPPLMSIAVLAMLIVVDVFLLVPAFRGRTQQTDPWLASACLILGPLHVIVATSLIALWACRSVAFSGRSKLWAATACIIVAALGAYKSVHFAPPTAGPGTGRLSLGFAFPLPVLWYQAVAPLFIGSTFMALRMKKLQTETAVVSQDVSRAA